MSDPTRFANAARQIAEVLSGSFRPPLHEEAMLRVRAHLFRTSFAAYSREFFQRPHLRPCLRLGGMFVLSEKFVESHGGKLGDISIYGQESNATTRRHAIMNLAIRGIEADFGREHADTFHRLSSVNFLLGLALGPWQHLR